MGTKPLPSASCDILILSLDTPELLRACVESVALHTPTSGRLILVNNGGGPAIQAYLEQLVLPAHLEKILLSFPENIGFIQGNNRAMEKTQAPYFCLLNNDTVVTEGWLEEMLGVMEAHPKIGLLNPVSNHTGSPLPKGWTVEEWACQRRKQYGGRFLESQKASGFCLLVRRAVYEKIGGFDEALDKAFFEDEDYTMRVKQAGWRVAQAQGSYLYHREHASFGRLNFDPEATFQKNRAWFEKKWGRAQRIAVALTYPPREAVQNHERFRFVLEPLSAASNHVSIFTNHRGLNAAKCREAVRFPEIGCTRTLRSPSFAFRLWWILQILKKRKKPYDALFTNDIGLLSLLVKLRRWIPSTFFYIVTQPADLASPRVESLRSFLRGVAIPDWKNTGGVPSEWRDKLWTSARLRQLRKEL